MQFGAERQQADASDVLHLRYNFVWQAAWYDLHDGFTTLIHSFIEENKAMFSQQRAIHIVLVLIMVSTHQQELGNMGIPVMLQCPDHVLEDGWHRCRDSKSSLPFDGILLLLRSAGPC